jgi:hypothetical protein
MSSAVLGRSSGERSIRICAMRRRAAVRNSDRLTDHSERASSKVIVALFGHDEARPGSQQGSRPNVGFHRTDT